jgi:hypothetical protein
MKGMKARAFTTCLLLSVTACDPAKQPRVFLGTPGTSVTHVVVEVRRGSVTADVWRLRSDVTVEGTSSQQLLPPSAPSHPVAFPATYKILAPDRTGLVAVTLDALDQEGRTVGRALGSVDLVEDQGVQLTVDLGLPCDTDPDCDDDVFCNGQERCVGRTCAAGERACPPSIHACVEITCSQEMRRCLTTAHHDLCASPPGGGDSGDVSYCDVAMGCLAGRLEPPGIVGEPVVTPPLGMLGTVFRLGFQASEPLAADPVVLVDVGGRRVGLLVDEGRTSRREHLYGYTYTADGSEQQGRRALTVDLVDLAGNAVTGLSAGGFTLDFTPPWVVGQGVLDTAFLKAGAVAHLDLTLSEATAGNPRLRMGLLTTRPEDATREWAWEQADGTRHQFTYQALGTEEEGAHALWLDAVDVAGNRGTWTQVGKVVLDFTPPRAVGAATVLPPVAAVGRTVVVEVHLAEAIVGSPTLAGVAGSARLPFSSGDNTGQRLSFFHVVEEGQDGTYDLLLELLVDAAGNQTPQEWVGQVVLDGTGPELQSYTQNLATLTAADVLEVGFWCSEPLGVDPVVRLGALDLVRVGAETSPYAYRVPLVGTDLVGRFAVTVEVADVVGNRRVVAPGSAVVDAVPPELVDAVFTPPVARLGITAYLSLTVSEVLQAPPVLGWDESVADPGFSFVARSGLTYTYGLPVGQDLTPGTYPLRRVAMADPLGNVVTAQPEDLGVVLDFTVDNVPPRVSNVRANRTRFSAQEGFRSFILTLDCSEPVDVAPASLAVTLSNTAVTCGTYQPEPPNYRCERQVTGEEPEGTGLIAVVATDRAGNVGVGNGAVDLDFSAPTLVASSATPAAAKLGDSITYAVTASEALARTPVLNVTGPGSVLFRHRLGTTYIFSHVVTDGSADGEHHVTMAMEDTVGNRAEGLLGAPFSVDGTPPRVSGLAADRAVYSAQPGFDVVTVTFRVDEDPAVVRALLAASPMDCEGVPGSPLDQVCTGLVAGSPGDDGVRQVSVTVADASGNVVLDGLAVATDFTPPAVAAGSVGVQLVAPPLSLVRQVSRATHGTTVRVFFASNESLVTAPRVFLVEEPHVAFSPAGGAGSFYIYDLPLGDVAMAQGGRTIAATMVDAVDNRSEGVPLTQGSSFDVDTEAPPSLGPGQAAQLEYVRIPWGAQRSSGQANYYVEESLVAGLEPGDTVILWDRPTVTTALEIGRGVVSVSGVMPRVVLNNSDRTQVFASVVDAAGNPDGAAAVRLPRVTWVATMNQKVPGSTVENPHRALARRSLGRLDQPVGVPHGTTEPDAAPLYAVDGRLTSVTTALDRWKRFPDADPPENQDVDMVFDTARGIMVAALGGTIGLVMEFADGRWTQVTPVDPETDGNPVPSGHRLAYDQRRNVVVLVPREAGTVMWEWDGRSWRNVPLQDPEGDGNPSWRRWFGLTYHETRQRVMLYGGETTNDNRRDHWVFTNQLWEYDGNSWRNVPHDDEDTWPPGMACNMAYDSTRDRVVLMGSPRPRVESEQTWEWTSGGWERVLTSTPSLVRDYRMAYDVARHRVVLHGGVDPMNSVAYNTWEYDCDARTWRRALAGNYASFDWPNFRIGAGMAYDRDLGRTVLYGGGSYHAWQAKETWFWDGAPWSKHPLVDPEGDGSPSGYSESPGAAWDVARSRAVIMTETWSFTITNHTWEWLGSSWKQAVPVDDLHDGNPSDCYAPGLTYDNARHVTVLFCTGYTAPTARTTWTWDGLEWTCRCGCGGSTTLCNGGDGLPPGRSAPAMVHDQLRGVVLMWGGSASDADLWQWDGDNWLTVGPATADRPPLSTWGPRLVHDLLRDVFVLLMANETNDPEERVWEWVVAESRWRGVVPADPEGDGNPSVPYDSAVHYDEARGKTLLSAGFWAWGDPSQVGDWLWDGVSWRNLGTLDSHGTHAATNRAWSRPDGEKFVHDGATWQHQFLPHSRQGLSAHFSLPAVQMLSGSVVETVTFTAIAGGRGLVDGVMTPGVSILAWHPGGWQSRASHTFDPDLVGSLSYTTASQAEIGALVAGNRFNFAVAPTGTNGVEGASLAVDYVEMELHYRLP